MPSRVSSVFFIRFRFSWFKFSVQKLVDDADRAGACTSSGVPMARSAPIVHHGNAVGDAKGQVAIVGHHDGGDVDALLQVQNFLADGDGHEGIEFAGRFIVENQLRLDDEGAGDGDALFHAAGKFGGRTILDAFQARGIPVSR